MTVGLAALAGVPPFAGFWSKDAILARRLVGQARRAGAPPGSAGSSGSPACSPSLLTAWYATRLWLRTFFGHAAQRRARRRSRARAARAA